MTPTSSMSMRLGNVTERHGKNNMEAPKRKCKGKVLDK